MARFKYYSDDDSWKSQSSVDNSTDDPTYAPENSKKKTNVGMLRKNVRSTRGRRGQAPAAKGGCRTGPSTSRQSNTDESVSEEDETNCSSLSEQAGVSESSGSDGEMNRRFKDLTKKPRESRANRRDAGGLLKTIEKEPFSLGISELPEDFCWTDEAPKPRLDCFNPLREPGTSFDGTELPVEIFLELHRPALVLLMESINETGAELVAEKKMRFFKKVDWYELLRFHAILIFCQSVKISRWEMYWKRTSPLYQPFVSQLMSFKRFKQLKRCVRCYIPSEVKEEGLSDPDNQNFDPLYKISSMQNLLLQRYREKRNPGREVTIDEQMIKFKVEQFFFCVAISHTIYSSLQ